VRRVKENGFTTQQIEPFYSMRIHPRTLNLPQRVYVTALTSSEIKKRFEIFLATTLFRKEKYWRKQEGVFT
jgi:hypothetical protein